MVSIMWGKSVVIAAGLPILQRGHSMKRVAIVLHGPAIEKLEGSCGKLG